MAMKTRQDILSIRSGIDDIHKEMTEIINSPERRDKQDRYSVLLRELTAANSELRSLEIKEAIEERLGQTGRPPLAPIGEIETPEGTEKRQYAENFRHYLRTGEKRDLALTTATQTTATSVLVPQAFSGELEIALKYYGPMLDVCRVHATPTGAPLPWPTANDTGNEATLIGEGALASEEDVTLSNIILGAFKYSTGVVKVSLELLQDSNFPLDSWLAEQFGRRLGRKLNTDFTVGAGTTEPFGLLTKAAAGPTATGSSTNDGSSATGATSIGTDDLVALEHSVDLAYRKNAAYMAHDTTVKALKQLKDKYGHPIFEPGEDGRLTTINGYPLYPNNDLPEIATGNKTMLFGAFQKYVIRQVKDLSVLRLVERYADYGQVGFIGFARFDGNLLDAGTNPVKYLAQA